MKYIAVIILVSLGFQSFAQEFNHGTNRHYTPYAGFAIPVAQPTPPNNPPPTGIISNREQHIATKSIAGAHSGIHFPAGTPGVETVRYDLYVTDATVHFAGKERHAIAINGSAPAGPTLVFTIGDTALIYVHNRTSEPTSVHWHGVQLPNRMDGVSYLTQLPIPPHTTHIYKFPVVQSGTYWYHSHYSLQEQIGLYGALIFNKRTEPDIPTIPVVLSDWSNTKPKEIARMLHTGNDWFAIKKHSTQSYWNALKAGKLGVKWVNEWKRMEAMDVSDVYYERFLVNGDTAQNFDQFRAGDRVRLRLVNGGASTYFWLKFSGGSLMVVANDGNDVVPVMVDRLIIAPSETYDVVVTIPQNMQYEFLATAEDRSGFASLWLGTGMKMPAEKLPPLRYFEGMDMMNKMMKMNGDMNPMGMRMSLQQMDMNRRMYPELDDIQNQTQHQHGGHGEVHNAHQDGHEVEADDQTHQGHGGIPSDANEIVTLNYNMLQATEETTLPEGRWKVLRFELTGNMNRYVWSLNNKTVAESDKIPIKKGENLRLILYNNSMMRHPMHLHGHDFRVLNQFGARSPMKNVLDIMPMETDTIDFHASERGDWFFHCHILYHMMSGMGRIFHYESNIDNPEIPNPEKAYKNLKKDNRMFHLMFQNDFATNGFDGMLMYAGARWAFQAEWRLGYTALHGYEVETHFGRYIGKSQWFFPYVGIDWRYRKHVGDEESIFGQPNSKNDRSVFHVGFEYTLPWLIILDASVDHTGYFRAQLMRDDIPLSPRLRGAFMVNTDREWMAGGRYILTKLFAVSTHYDSDMGWGVGVTLTY